MVIYRENELLWTHARVPRGQRSTVEAHLPERRRHVCHRSREHWMKLAGLIGPEVKDLMDANFGSDDVLLKLGKVQTVVTHLQGFPPSRARRAAKRALPC